MIAQAADLVGERGGADLVVLWLPLVPVLPVVAAAPSGHHHDAHAVGEVEEVVGLELAFEPYGVQAHVADVGELSLELLFGFFAEQQVGCPPAAADEERAAVDFELAIAFRGEFAGYGADGEVDRL